MRKLALLATAALFFALSPLSGKLGPVPGSLLLVLLALVLSLSASGAISSLAILGGALGAFAGGIVAPLSPALAGAAVVALCFAERSTRVRTRSARLLHLGIALAGGALAGWIATAFAGSPLALRAVAVTVAAVLVALPLLVEADDPLAHALDGAAAEIQGPAQVALREGAELRRTIDEELLDRKTARQVGQTWQSLLLLAETRVRLSRTTVARKAEGAKEKAPLSPAEAVVAKVDARIANHVAALTRAYLAVDTARAAAQSLDDSALRGTETMGESFEQVSKAIVEEV